MARLNFETSIYREQGFQDLLIETKSRHAAKGICIEFWELAQEYWFPDRLLIPISVFEAKGLPHCLYAPGGLAERRGDFIYSKGSEANFKWLFDAQQKGKKGGKKSAKRQRDSKGRLLPKKESEKIQAVSKLEPITVQDETKPVQSSLLSSPFSLLSTPNSDLSSQELAEPSPKLGSKVKPFVALYIELFKAKYGSIPKTAGKEFGIAKRIVDGINGERAALLLEAYFALPDAYVVKARHPLGLMETKLNEIGVWADTGRFSTNREMRNADDSMTNSLLLEQVRKGQV